MIVWGGGSNTGGRYTPSTDSWLPTSMGANVPASRSSHTAAWTGNEMIVWGGGSNTGGRYTPSTDSWLPTSMGANVPTSRSSHTAIWTGSELIVWGGTVGGFSLNTGGRYNPSTDSWLATSIGTNVPAANYGHTAIWTGSEMIVWGGDGGYGSPLNTGGRYNPSTDSWIATSIGANVPAARYVHTAVWTGSEMIVWGGWRFSYLNTGGRYNPTTDSWIATSIGANVPGVRYDHIAVWTGSEMIVWGGVNGCCFSYVNTGGRYSPSTDSWLATSFGANVPSARDFYTAVWTGSEMIIWGGWDGFSTLNSGGRYNPSTDSWLATSVGANVPTIRRYHAAIWTGSEMIVWGGDGGGFGLYLNTGGRYNLSTNSWNTTSMGANVPAARSRHTSIWTGSEMIAWGGGSNTGGRYNSLTDSWLMTSIVNAPAARYSHTAIWTGVEMIVWGGNGGSNTGGRYNPSCSAPAMSVNLGSKAGPDVMQTWTLVASAASYNVYRNPSNNPATWGAALATGITGLSYSDSGQLSNTTSQFYSVTDVNTCGAESDK